MDLVFGSNQNSELGTQVVYTGVVLPVRDLGAGDDPIVSFCRPARSYSLKDWFDGREVHARVTLNINIVGILDAINYFKVVVSD